MDNLLNLDSLLGDCVTPPDYGENDPSKNVSTDSNQYLSSHDQTEIIPSSSLGSEEITQEDHLVATSNDMATARNSELTECRPISEQEDTQLNNQIDSNLSIETEVDNDEIDLQKDVQVIDTFLDVSNVIGSANLSEIIIENIFKSNEVRKEILENFGLRPFESTIKNTYGLDDNFISFVTAKSLGVEIFNSNAVEKARDKDSKLLKVVLKDDGFIEIAESGGVYTYYVWAPSGIVAAKESFLAIERDCKEGQVVSGRLKICTKQAAVKLISTEFCQEWFKSIPRSEYTATLAVYLKNQREGLLLVEPTGGEGQRISIWMGGKRIYSRLLPIEVFDDVVEFRDDQSLLEREVAKALKSGGQVGGAINALCVNDATAIEAYELISTEGVGYKSADAIFIKTNDSEFVLSFARALLYKNGDERPVLREGSSIGVVIKQRGDVYQIQLGNKIDELEFIQNSRLLTLEECKINRAEIM